MRQANGGTSIVQALEGGTGDAFESARPSERPGTLRALMEAVHLHFLPAGVLTIVELVPASRDPSVAAAEPGKGRAHALSGSLLVRTPPLEHRARRLGLHVRLRQPTQRVRLSANVRRRDGLKRRNDDCHVGIRAVVLSAAQGA